MEPRVGPNHCKGRLFRLNRIVRLDMMQTETACVSPFSDR